MMPNKNALNILMMTNTYKPIVGGLEKSIESFVNEYGRLGHRAIVVAPEFDGMEEEDGVVRVPAIHNFNGSEFSVKLPLPGVLDEALGDFKPDVVHAHHPFLVGATALRVASKHHAPLVFTHHVLFEQNTHYVPGGDTEIIKRFVVELATGYANLADRVFAPSRSLARMIVERGVETPVDVVPTGIDVKRLASGDGAAVRAACGVSERAFVVGHLGRLAPEKNLEFLSRAVARFCASREDAHFLVAGKGPSEDAIRATFAAAGLGNRLHLTGPLQGKILIDAYHAMDAFAFASQSETQGLVLVEAMSAGVPVVGVDACGVRDVVEDGKNGKLLAREDEADFAAALAQVADLPLGRRRELSENAVATAAEYSMEKCARRALSIYADLVETERFRRYEHQQSAWEKTMRRIKAEWELMKNFTKATTGAVIHKDDALPDAQAVNEGS